MSGGNLDAAAFAHHHEHRVEHPRSAPKARALRELVQNFLPSRRRTGEQREGSPAQHMALEAIAHRALALSQEQHPEVSARKQGRSGERAQ
jgi:hypothetical protein